VGYLAAGSKIKREAIKSQHVSKLANEHRNRRDRDNLGTGAEEEERGANRHSLRKKVGWGRGLAKSLGHLKRGARNRKGES